MSWSYNTALQSARDQVRFWCGDTNSSNQLVSNEEIEFVLRSVTNVKLAAADILDRLSVQYASMVDTQVGDLRKSYGKISDNFASRAKALRRQVPPTPYAGGVSASRVGSNAEDSDIVAPPFRIGMMDHPEAPGLLDMLVDDGTD